MAAMLLPLRQATAADVPALASLYTQAAVALGPQVYGPEQVRAWASFAQDGPQFAHYILSAETWIAEDGSGVPLGFCGIARDGEVHSLYVHPSHGRRGLGRQLLGHALAHAAVQGVRRFSAWATPFSRPLFERAGFTLAEVRREPYQGVLFDRYRLYKEG